MREPPHLRLRPDVCHARRFAESCVRARGGCRYVTTPSGVEVTVEVPDGIGPGDEFEVQVRLRCVCCCTEVAVWRVRRAVCTKVWRRSC